MIVLWLLVMVAVLFGIFLVGWFIISPPLEWACHKLVDLSARGHEYRALVRQERESSDLAT